jgi:hypothetical protein
MQPAAAIGCHIRRTVTKEAVMDVGLAGAALFIGLFGFLAVAAWAGIRTEERKEFYRHELYQQMLQNPGPAADALRTMFEQEALRRRQDSIGGMRLGGLITAAVGVGLGVFLYSIEPERPVFLVGLIPFLVGCALLFYGFILAPRTLKARGDFMR